MFRFHCDLRFYTLSLAALVRVLYFFALLSLYWNLYLFSCVRFYDVFLYNFWLVYKSIILHVFFGPPFISLVALAAVSRSKFLVISTVRLQFTTALVSSIRNNVSIIVSFLAVSLLLHSIQVFFYIKFCSFNPHLPHCPYLSRSLHFRILDPSINCFPFFFRLVVLQCLNCYEFEVC